MSNVIQIQPPKDNKCLEVLNKLKELMDISNAPPITSFRKLKAIRDITFYPSIYSLSSTKVFKGSCDDFDWMLKALTRFENLEEKISSYIGDVEYDVYPVYKFVYRLKEVAPMPALTYIDLVVVLKGGLPTEVSRYADVSAYYRLYTVFSV